jgi:PAS domain S-box-containing protein
MNHKIKLFPANNHLSKSGQIERYRLLVESIQDYAIFLLDTTGHIATWNAGAKRLKGYNEDEIIGKHFSVFYPKEDKDRAKPEWELEEAKKYGSIEDEGWRIRKDGTRFWANVVITALYDESGVLQGFAKVTRDLTERKQIEDELQRANAELRRQQQELMILNQAKDEFISLASHQLRTPATGVKQYLGLILQGFMGEIPKELLPILQKAYESNERQIELVNDLLRVAQVDAGKLILNKVPCNITSIVKDAVAEQRASFKKRSQIVEINTPDNPINANVDSGRLRMVLDNLIDNASKYTPKNGKISIYVNCNEGELRICVADNGVGVKEEDLPRLFHKFSRVGNELSEEVGGSGLGLYWAHKVVEKHGGKIQVESKHKHGTKFTVIVPSGSEND